MTQPQQAQEPVLAALYGPSGAGKTTDCLYSFPGGIFIAQPGALKPAESVCGYKPAAVTVRTLQEALGCLEQYAKITGPDGQPKYDSFIIDDFSLMSEETFSGFEKKYSGFALFGEMRDLLFQFIRAARWSKMNVILNSHERAPHTDQRKGFVRGGPRLPGTMPEELPGHCDVVLRVMPAANARRGWKTDYRSSYDPNYVTKDRYDSPDFAPPNIGEMLRLANHSIRRLKGLEWQEQMVEKIAQSIAARGPTPSDEQVTEVLVKAREAMLQQYTTNELHIRWALRDGVHRAELRSAKKNPSAIWGIPA